MITYEECEMQVWIPPKQHRQVPRVWLITPASTRSTRPHGRGWTSRPSSITVLPFYSWYWQFQTENTEKKNWLLKNYYSSKLIWPCRSIGQQSSDDPKPLGLLIALSLLFIFFCKTKKELRNVTESEYKKMYLCIMLPRHTRILFSSTFSPWQYKQWVWTTQHETGYWISYELQWPQHTHSGKA